MRKRGGRDYSGAVSQAQSRLNQLQSQKSQSATRISQLQRKRSEVQGNLQQARNDLQSTRETRQQAEEKRQQLTENRDKTKQALEEQTKARNEVRVSLNDVQVRISHQNATVCILNRQPKQTVFFSYTRVWREPKRADDASFFITLDQIRALNLNEKQVQAEIRKTDAMIERLRHEISNLQERRDGLDHERNNVANDLQARRNDAHRVRKRGIKESTRITIISIIVR